MERKHMRYLSLFSGIEAATVAWDPLGWEPVAFAEFEDFPKAVLAHHYPEIPDLGDVTKITEEQIKALGPIDLVVGGSPCQDLSIAGKRAGLRNEDGSVTRSGLFGEQMRIFEIARIHNGCRYLLWENVPGAFSSNKGRDFAYVIDAMVGGDIQVPEGGWKNSGVGISLDGSRCVEWRVLDAQYFGVPQRRRRIFALLDTGAWWGRSPILFEQDGLCWDPAKSADTGKGVAERIEDGVGSGSAYAAMTGQTGSNGLGISKEIAYTLNCAKDQAVMAFDTTQITSPDNGSHPKPGAPCHPLASQAHPPAVIYENHAQGSRVTRCEDGVAPTITSRMGTGGGNLPFVLAPPPDRMEVLYPKVVGALLARDYKGIGRADSWSRMIVTRESQAE
ncbi:MAG: DNA cytosine methyltransferase [Spirochaetia bacterium]|nr:DNA cytosine methyltransferase [Spirochaetia bacterium]